MLYYNWSLIFHTNLLATYLGDYVGILINRYRKIKTLYIILISSFVFLITLIYFFNSNSVISSQGIRCNNIILSTTSYSWNDFQGGTIYSINERIRKHSYKYKLHYELYTKDKKAYDMRKARHFWDKVLVINNLVEKNNIKLDRSQLDYEDAISLLVDDYDSTDLDKGIKILKEIKLFTGDIPPESPYTQLMKEILK